MTDPNVLKAIRLICNAAYHAIPGNDSTGSGMALTLLDKADALLAAAEKPAEVAPVDRCVARGCMASATHTDVQEHLSAPCCGGEKCCGVPYGWSRVPLAGEVAAAPTVAAVAPVKFTDDGDAFGTDWEATRSSAGDNVFVTITLRPGEDAGETVAKMLAPVGRGP